MIVLWTFLSTRRVSCDPGVMIRLDGVGKGGVIGQRGRVSDVSPHRPAGPKQAARLLWQARHRQAYWWVARHHTLTTVTTPSWRVDLQSQPPTPDESSAGARLRRKYISTTEPSLREAAGLSHSWTGEMLLSLLSKRDGNLEEGPVGDRSRTFRTTGLWIPNLWAINPLFYSERTQPGKTGDQKNRIEGSITPVREEGRDEGREIEAGRERERERQTVGEWNKKENEREWENEIEKVRREERMSEKERDKGRERENKGRERERECWTHADAPSLLCKRRVQSELPSPQSYISSINSDYKWQSGETVTHCALPKALFIKLNAHTHTHTHTLTHAHTHTLWQR